MATWAIKVSYGYTAVEVVKETAECVFHIDREWGRERETRAGKSKFLDWRGSEDDARAIREKLTSAKAEYDRRCDAAGEWFKKRKAEILAAPTP